MDTIWLAVRQYGCSVADLYHRERNHQGLDNKLICPEPKVIREGAEVNRRERLGGLLNYYYRSAA